MVRAPGLAAGWVPASPRRHPDRRGVRQTRRGSGGRTGQGQRQAADDRVHYSRSPRPLPRSASGAGSLLRWPSRRCPSRWRRVAPQYHATYAPVYGDNLAADYAVPEPLDRLELDLEGSGSQWSRSARGGQRLLGAVRPVDSGHCPGDQVFSGVHVWLVEYRPQGRWRASGGYARPARSAPCCQDTAPPAAPSCWTKRAVHLRLPTTSSR